MFGLFCLDLALCSYNDGFRTMILVRDNLLRSGGKKQAIPIFCVKIMPSHKMYESKIYFVCSMLYVVKLVDNDCVLRQFAHSRDECS